jgi:hypothetical protein
MAGANRLQNQSATNGVLPTLEIATEQKNAPELPIGRFLKSKSLGGNRVILNVLSLM